MISFEDWFKDLCSNYVWYQPASMHHEPKTFRDTANKVYMQYVAAEQFPPIQEARKHVYNKLVLLTPDKVKVDWVAKAIEKDKKKQNEDWRPASKEHADKCAKEALEIIANSKTLNYFPKVTHKQAVEEGDWIPKKQANWPVTTPEEAYVRDRHFEWIKTCFEPRTGEKNLNYVPEEDFNIWYDVEYLNGKGL